MAHLYRDLGTKSLYTDRKCEGGTQAWQRAIEESTTLYIGNLSFYTTEEQLYALFSLVGEVKRIVMGLDRNAKTPCGFCFVEYHRRSDTEDAVRYINGCKLDDRVVRVDWDGGFVEGRQYGRGRSGGQVREEYRTDFDAGRGGWGKATMEAQDLPLGPPAAFGGPMGRRASLPATLGGGGRGGRGGDDDDEAPSAKRSKQEANPRFREDKDDDDDDD